MGSRDETYVPEPCLDSMTPSADIALTASLRELRDTPSCAANSASGGHF
ncbi:hypothetical protein CVCC1112_3011 [Paenarthrobacter nicotinovorans]|nr:hypothetical protein CVCC1112_3011 [Paenarthrobacter nicotinovorans]